MPLTFAEKVFGSIPLILVCALFGCQPRMPVAIPSPGITDLTIPAGSKIVDRVELSPDSVMYKFDNKAGWDIVETHIESQLLAKGFFVEASLTVDSNNSLRFYLSEDRLILVQLIQTRFTKQEQDALNNSYPEFNIGISKLDTPFPED